MRLRLACSVTALEALQDDDHADEAADDRDEGARDDTVWRRLEPVVDRPSDHDAARYRPAELEGERPVAAVSDDRTGRRHQLSARTRRAATTRRSMLASSWASETNIVSNCEGGRYIPSA